jgi:GT2 family glycosyltransferase
MSRTPLLDISFIILTWNSETYIRRCLDSLVDACRKDGVTFEVIVVDNGSIDGSVATLQHYHSAKPDIFRLIQFHTNKGTTFSRNIGIRLSRGRHICILDSDTEFAGGSIREVLDYLQANHSVGFIAPKLLLSDGKVQHSVKCFPAFWHKLLKIPKALFRIRVVDFDFYKQFPFKETTKVDTAIAACWFFRKELLDTVGLFDEKIFYAPEDLDFCLRVNKKGKIILYWPSLTLLHHCQQISHNKPFSRTSLSHLGGLIYYYRKHGGWLRAHSFTVRRR